MTGAIEGNASRDLLLQQATALTSQRRVCYPASRSIPSSAVAEASSPSPP